MAHRSASRRDHDAGDEGPGRTGRLLRQIPAAAGAGRGGPGGRTGPSRIRGLDLRCDHRGNAAANPAVRGPHRLAHPGPDAAAVAAAGLSRRALPRRGGWPADVEGLRPGQGADGCDQGGYQGAPRGDHGHSSRGVLVGAGSGVDRGARYCAGRRGGRPQATGRSPGLSDGTAGPAPHSRGLFAVA